VLALIRASVSAPDTALLPDQPPLARQLVATGFVDQVKTGTRLVCADVEFACSVTTPAVCACAAPAPSSKVIKTDRAEYFALIVWPPVQKIDGTHWWRDRSVANA
jgi:hypothetical protein